MFDLISFIRQYLPPQKRTTVTIALCELLFSPILSLFQTLTRQRQALLTGVQRRGQVVVLEELLNEEAFGSSVGSVYILDSQVPTSDFRVYVPGDVSPDVVGRLLRIVNTNKLAGKRYEISYESTYVPPPTPPDQVALAFTSGYPYTDATRLYWAINQTGTFRTVVRRNGNIVFDTDFGYSADVPTNSAIGEPGDVFEINVAGVIGTTTRATGTVPTQPVINKTYYQLNQFVQNGATQRNLSLYVDGDALTNVMNVLIQGLNGTVVRSSPSGKVMDAPTTGIAKPGLIDGKAKYQCLFPADAFGTFRITIQVGATAVKKVYDVVIDAAHSEGLLVEGANPNNTLTPATASPPTVSRSLNPPNVTASGTQTYQVPADTFSDISTLTYSATSGNGSALPDGITFAPASRTFSYAASLGDATYALRIIATNTANLSSSVTFSQVVSRVVAPVIPPGSTDGFTVSGIILNHPNVMNPQINWRTIDGVKWAYITDLATYTVRDGDRAQYFVDGVNEVGTFAQIMGNRLYPPHTEVSLFCIVSPDPLNKTVFVTDKASAQVYIGSAPN